MIMNTFTHPWEAAFRISTLNLDMRKQVHRGNVSGLDFEISAD